MRSHWPEYLIEAAGLAAFMISACAFAVAIFHPASPGHAALGSVLGRRAAMGAAMGATAMAIIYSPWGRRSGAHLNPAVSIAFSLRGDFPWRRVPVYIVVQLVGLFMPSSIIRHSTTEDAASETQPKREFDPWRVAADIVRRLREAGISCELGNVQNGH